MVLLPMAGSLQAQTDDGGVLGAAHVDKAIERHRVQVSTIGAFCTLELVFHERDFVLFLSVLTGV